MVIPVIGDVILENGMDRGWIDWIRTTKSAAMLGHGSEDEEADGATKRQGSK